MTLGHVSRENNNSEVNLAGVRRSCWNATLFI